MRDPTTYRGRFPTAPDPESHPPTEAQEKEIAENLSNIQKVQRTQMKCRKVGGELGALGSGGCCRKWGDENFRLEAGSAVSSAFTAL